MEFFSTFFDPFPLIGAKRRQPPAHTCSFPSLTSTNCTVITGAGFSRTAYLPQRWEKYLFQVSPTCYPAGVICLPSKDATLDHTFKSGEEEELPLFVKKGRLIFVCDQDAIVR